MVTASETVLRLRHLCNVLNRYAYRFGNEIQLHEAMQAALQKEVIPHVRERIIGPDRFDFFLPSALATGGLIPEDPGGLSITTFDASSINRGGIVIEAKIGGSVAEAVRQVERYCAHDEVQGAVIVSSRQWRAVQGKTDFTLRNKPVHMLSLRRQSF